MITNLFTTPLYRADRNALGSAIDNEDLLDNCYAIAEDDEAGQAWCEENGYIGYTSYASLLDLPWRNPAFKALADVLMTHAQAFAKDLHFDLDDKQLHLDSLWINIMPEGGIHTGHIHPHSVISGTTYLQMPPGTSALKLEDPRLAMMMAAPLRAKDAPDHLKQFYYVEPAEGEIVLWESWLRHEVMMNGAEEERVSVSFNFGWR